MIGPEEIVARARERFGEPNKRLSSKNELRFGRQGSISVVLVGQKAASWFSHEAQQGGSLLSAAELPALPAARTSGRRSVLTWDSDSEQQFRRVIDRELRQVEAAHTRAPGIRPIERAPAHEYLISRGIDRWPAHSVMGWVSGIAYLARSASGQILAVQILPLTPDGRKNRAYWSDGVTKRTYTAARGWHHYAAVRMPGRGELVLCEGVETGLSIWLATGRPVAACMGLAGMASLRCGRRVTIATDGNDPGSPADVATQRAITERRSSGQRVRVAVPPLGTDFNDLLAPEIAAIIKDAK